MSKRKGIGRVEPLSPGPHRLWPLTRYCLEELAALLSLSWTAVTPTAQSLGFPVCLTVCQVSAIFVRSSTIREKRGDSSNPRAQGQEVADRKCGI